MQGILMMLVEQACNTTWTSADARVAASPKHRRHAPELWHQYAQELQNAPSRRSQNQFHCIHKRAVWLLGVKMYPSARMQYSLAQQCHLALCGAFCRCAFQKHFVDLAVHCHTKEVHLDVHTAAYDVPLA